MSYNSIVRCESPTAQCWDGWGDVRAARNVLIPRSWIGPERKRPTLSRVLS